MTYSDYILPFMEGDVNGVFGTHHLSPDDVGIIQELRGILENAQHEEVKKIILDDINNYLMLRFYYFSGSSD